MGFSQNLKDIRKDKNLSQEQLAEMLNVSRQSVSKWEQDNGYPETEKLIQIAELLDVSLDYLLLNKQPAEPESTKPAVNTTAFSGERKIMIQSSDGRTISAFYKFTISTNYLTGKNQPRCTLFGIDKRSFWGDNLVMLGWYATHEDAQRELKEILEAMQKGEATYQLKYFAKVTLKTFGVMLDNE